MFPGKKIVSTTMRREAGTQGINRNVNIFSKNFSGFVFLLANEINVSNRNLNPPTNLNTVKFV